MAKRILIVDDSRFMRKMIRSILERDGYEIVGEAENGLEALESYQSLRPDLVTLDITMPEMSGLSALKALCSTHPTAKVVMVSAMGQKDIIIDSIMAGAKDFIVKPFDSKKVIETVRNVLSFNAKEQQLVM